MKLSIILLIILSTTTLILWLKLAKNIKLGKIISKVGLRCLKPSDIEALISSFLKDIGKAIGANRGYVVLFNENSTAMSCSYKWIEGGIDPNIESIEQLFSNTSLCRSHQLKKHEMMAIENVLEMPQQARIEQNILLKQNIKSIIMLPILQQGTLSGFVVFDYIKKHKKWDRYDKMLLEAFAAILGDAFERKKIYELLADHLSVCGISRKIMSLKELENHIQASGQWSKLLYEHNLAGVFSVDIKGKFTMINPMAEKMTGYHKDELLGKHFSTLLKEDELPKVSKNLQRVLYGKIVYEEITILTKRNQLVNINLLTVPIWIKDSIAGVYGITEDVTEKKELQRKLLYVENHDSLTDLYNRRYFENEMDKIDQMPPSSVAIIICDIDGLKLVNETLGHHRGDILLLLTASNLRIALKGRGVLARIGGDEFGILLKNIQEDEVINICETIKNAMEEYNHLATELPIKISIGFAISYAPIKTTRKVFKEADDHLYREKLNSTNSSRYDIVATIMKMLQERDIITRGHVDRVQQLMILLAKHLELPSYEINDLNLLAQFHDIGKIGIADSILMKPGPLTDSEFEIIKKHCEIGYRIIHSVPSLEVIADLVLKHHERWDGTGYPLGLKNTEIPLACRILSIIDAYDAITSQRPYKKALPHHEAIQELIRCSGTQFDPDLVEAFIALEEKIV